MIGNSHMQSNDHHHLQLPKKSQHKYDEKFNKEIYQGVINFQGETFNTFIMSMNLSRLSINKVLNHNTNRIDSR